MGPTITIFTGNKATFSLQKEDNIIYLRNRGYQRRFFCKMNEKEKTLSARKKKNQEIEVLCSEPYPRKKSNERKTFLKSNTL